jgi:hypothetical protein|mmetsp:Transcript_26671/g.45331  ORF Transcript_26671/g.45331 Transcript_26671/m.45331 type:complete len:151 (-) Transcript_26671:783-1235(-)|eukprot:CAMPEP_0174281874 /NCGR_PEP_ID=MMETSP0809-20121228/2288_1 /TAXON_ID=73025 ORGANISM="Eutreptiella gymnastica-like, Strain CCMP1594" /NCGR_SAMPLE_ID=MMETSP0809 /ASSEMBLY_ACC=CAM_ASM_000658 /LENGTH=150 /DNA_ID=CAMNT_0015375709 /DNA_START=43 /DNA_END=495 /DNA_ORIENTATION=-
MYSYEAFHAEKVARQQRMGYIRIGLALWAAVGAVLVVMSVVSPRVVETNLAVQTQTSTRVAPAAVNAQTQVQRVASGAAAAAGAAMVQAPQAMALVDERLNGDGARLILGVNEPILGWVLLSVFGLVWAFYATSVKGISNNDDEDSGLSL